jgi:hypothetical protein
VVTPVSKASKSQESLFRTVQAILQHHKGAKTHALILEDDIDVNPALSIQQQDIMTHVANTCEGLPNDWDAFKLEICYNICFLSKDISKHVKKTFSSVCAGANIYNVNRIESICDCINAYKPKVIDYAIDRCKPKLNIYYHTPPIFVQLVAWERNLAPKPPLCLWWWAPKSMVCCVYMHMTWFHNAMRFALRCSIVAQACSDGKFLQ